MTYALILDSNQYHFAKLIANEKKHSVIQLDGSTSEKKIKNDNLILSFAADPATLSSQIETTRQEVDLDLLWELSEEKHHWTWQELVQLYFSEDSLVHQLGLFLAISEPAIYFSYLGEHQFKRCSPEEVTERKIQIQRQQEYQAKFDALYATLYGLQQPEWNIDPLSLINKPDKNSLEYKVAIKVAKDLKISLLELLFKLGYISSVEELLFKSFQKQYFPDGTELAALEIADHASDIPLNDKLTIFSIDDSLTTEIDDAFSLQVLADGWIIGVHISAPSLNTALLDIASERLSTVYYPGHKITMLPENVIAHYSLDQGKQLPVVSIYFTLDAEFNILSSESKLEQVIISDNLRIENLEQYFNHENLAQEHGYPYEKELKLLHNFALKLEEKRGKTSVNQLMLDYNFSFSPEGKIEIKPRVRGNPIDKLVSELMILANCSWGRMLTNAFIPAIYRVKQPMQPVVMTLTPNSHTGLNVDYYTWASSPLRRSVDLVNQAQIISLLRNQKPLAATDFAVANVVENFDETYGAYLKFQDSMERYWSLRYFEQENIHQIQATFTYRNNAQLEGVPITIDMGAYCKAQPAGTQVTLAISNLNFMTQTFEVKLLT
jgi:exoribonuclease-2